MFIYSRYLSIKVTEQSCVFSICSQIYHACDGPGLSILCIMKYEILEYFSVYGTAISMWVTLLGEQIIIASPYPNGEQISIMFCKGINLFIIKYTCTPTGQTVKQSDLKYYFSWEVWQVFISCIPVCHVKNMCPFALIQHWEISMNPSALRSPCLVCWPRLWGSTRTAGATESTPAPLEQLSSW